MKITKKSKKPSIAETTDTLDESTATNLPELTGQNIELLLNSKEFQTPISEEEAEDYLEAATNESAINAIEKIDTEALNECVTNYLTDVYTNVQDFSVSSCKIINEQLLVEGKIKFKSGDCKKTIFNFKPYGKNLLKGYNNGLAEKAEFTLAYNLEAGNKLITEGLKYSYVTKSSLVEGLSVRK